MCRNIKVLYNFEPAASEEEVRAAALQFVRKISGSNKPSKTNQKVFNAAVDDISLTVSVLLKKLTTNAKPRNREQQAELSRQYSVNDLFEG